MTPQEMERRVLYRDGMILVIDKPGGIPVHKGRGGGEHLEQYFDALRFGLPAAPSLAHRLDRNTSGCLALGRHRKALQMLGKLFEQNKVQKTYWALVHGQMPEPAGRIDLPLGKKSALSHLWHMKVDPQGQPAITDYAVRGSAGDYSWVEFTPLTGRTHQLRVHSAALGCPIVGDATYGSEDPSAPLHLHARGIALPLYPKKPPIRVTAPLPQPLLSLFAQCGYNEEKAA